MTELPVKQTLTLLQDTPMRMAALIAGLSPAQLQTRPFPDEWSATELLAHLRLCSDVWGSCMRTILEQDKPTIKAINPTTWINKSNYPFLDFASSFSAFMTQRDELLVLLNTLTPEQWSRSATVTGAGKPLERTVQFYAQWLARHERSHVKQFKQIANAFGA